MVLDSLDLELDIFFLRLADGELCIQEDLQSFEDFTELRVFYSFTCTFNNPPSLRKKNTSRNWEMSMEIRIKLQQNIIGNQRLNT